MALQSWEGPKEWLSFYNGRLQKLEEEVPLRGDFGNDLLEIKEMYYWYLGLQVNDDVVSISAYFNDSQTTKDAGLIGEVNIMRIINETIIAAVVYGLDNKNKNEICKDIFQKYIQPMNDALKDTWKKVRSSSWRSSHVFLRSRSYFKTTEFNKTLNPDQAVAYRTVLQTSLKNNLEEDGLDRWILIHATPLSLGIRMERMSIIIKSN